MEQSTVLGAFAGSDTTLICGKLENMAQRDNGNLLAGLYEERGLTFMSGMVIYNPPFFAYLHCAFESQYILGPRPTTFPHPPVPRRTSNLARQIIPAWQGEATCTANKLRLS